jgi:hypothetical protein
MLAEQLVVRAALMTAPSLMTEIQNQDRGI